MFKCLHLRIPHPYQMGRRLRQTWLVPWRIAAGHSLKPTRESIGCAYHMKKSRDLMIRDFWWDKASSRISRTQLCGDFTSRSTRWGLRGPARFKWVRSSLKLKGWLLTHTHKRDDYIFLVINTQRKSLCDPPTDQNDLETIHYAFVH